jgi:hypothetical protein
MRGLNDRFADYDLSAPRFATPVIKTKRNRSHNHQADKHHLDEELIGGYGGAVNPA